MRALSGKTIMLPEPEAEFFGTGQKFGGPSGAAAGLGIVDPEFVIIHRQDACVLLDPSSELSDQTLESARIRAEDPGPEPGDPQTS